MAGDRFCLPSDKISWQSDDSMVLPRYSAMASTDAWTIWFISSVAALMATSSNSKSGSGRSSIPISSFRNACISRWRSIMTILPATPEVRQLFTKMAGSRIPYSTSFTVISVISGPLISISAFRIDDRDSPAAFACRLISSSNTCRSVIFMIPWFSTSFAIAISSFYSSFFLFFRLLFFFCFPSSFTGSLSSSVFLRLAGSSL